MDYLKILASDFNEKFSDLKQIDFPLWVMQPMLVNVSMQYQEEFSDMQIHDSVKTLFSMKGSMAWFFYETEVKYPNLTKFSRKLLLPFPSSYLAEYGFSAVFFATEEKKLTGYH